MRRLFAALILSLSFVLPAAAHADSFQYTIVWDFPHVGTANTSAFLGTYTFTVDSLLSGTTFVYGPGFIDSPFHGLPYVYAADFTTPAASNVSQIAVTYDSLTSYFGFALYQKAGGSAVSTSLLQDSTDPNKFFGDYGDGSGSFVSMQIADLSTSPVPEPSTITLFGFGTLALGASIYRRVAHA
jgi:PEP-CTERM motif